MIRIATAMFKSIHIMWLCIRYPDEMATAIDKVLYSYNRVTIGLCEDTDLDEWVEV